MADAQQESTWSKNAPLLLAGVLLTVAFLAPMIVDPWAPRPSSTSEALPTATSPSSDDKLPDAGPMIRIPGGAFRMGDDFAPYVDARPAHDVSLDTFWLDEHEVTNAQFARFVDDTNHVTDAESRGWGYVFDTVEGEWIALEGATWRTPNGPHTTIDGRDDYPVVLVSWNDAVAYAEWAGRRLPTEAEWEYAARGGWRGRAFPWGDEELVDGAYQANYWQGWFPDEDRGADGFRGLAPVRQFPSNHYGLFDMAGNVWEWCADWHADDYYARTTDRNPLGPDSGIMRVQRGGSWTSSENREPAYRIALRSKRRPGVACSDVGFRCASDTAP